MTVDLVTVRCGPCGNWLAALYSDPGGATWLRYETRQLVDPGDFRLIPSPRPGGRVEGRTGYAPLTGDAEAWLAISCKKCRSPWPMTATVRELLSKAESARHGKTEVVIAKPTASLRDGGFSKP